ncbi:UNVERIFIED_CONTAM: YT521-B family protein [Hammondia hammondi]|eukprot:XP_008887380.1 YT521-B family protein [Hammondia hammondi]
MRSRPGECRFKSDLFRGAEGPHGVSQSRFEGKTFDLEWIRRTPLDFRECEGLLNPLNQNLPVYRARDGQEVAPAVGRAVCGIFETQWQKLAPPVSPSVSSVPSLPAAVGLHAEAPAPASPRDQGDTCQLSPLAGRAEREIPAGDMKARQRHAAPQGGGGAEDAWGPRIVNPAIQIYPLDLTTLTYDGYIRAYQTSRAYWRRRTEASRSEEEKREAAKEREQRRTRLLAARNLRTEGEGAPAQHAKRTEGDAPENQSKGDTKKQRVKTEREEEREDAAGERRDTDVEEEGIDEREEVIEAEPGDRESKQHLGEGDDEAGPAIWSSDGAEASNAPVELAGPVPETSEETGAEDMAAESQTEGDTLLTGEVQIKREREETSSHSGET